MTTNCPVCETDGYTKRSGCENCGHYDEDWVKMKKREKERHDRRPRGRY